MKSFHSYRRIIPVLLSALAAGIVLLVACTKDEAEAAKEKNSVYGTVTDFNSGEPVSNANVKLMPGGESTLTGSDGAYEIKDIEDGEYKLVVSKAEYDDLEDNYTIKLSNGKKFRRDLQIKRRTASLRLTDINGNEISKSQAATVSFQY